MFKQEVQSSCYQNKFAITITNTITIIIILIDFYKREDCDYTPNSEKGCLLNCCIVHCALLHTQIAKHHGCNQVVHCCMPRPQIIVFHIASMANTRMPLSHSRYLQCYLKIRYIHGALRSGYATIHNAQCNNSEDALFLIRCIQMVFTSTDGIHRIHNGAQTTKSRLDRLLLLSFAGLRLSKAAPGVSFSVRTTAVEFEEAFAILQFCIRAIRTPMLVQPRSDVCSPPL